MKEWYKIELFGKEVNWASVVASGVIFISLELYRRRNLRKQVQNEVAKEVKQLALNQNTSSSSVLDDIIDRLT